MSVSAFLNNCINSVQNDRTVLNLEEYCFETIRYIIGVYYKDFIINVDVSK